MSIMYFTVPALLAIGIVQFENWRKYRYQGNGANLQRFGMFLGSFAALSTCTGCIIGSLVWVAWSVSIVPIVGLILYAPSSIFKAWERIKKNHK